MELGGLKPDWQSECGNCVLFHADCRNILPKLPAGLIDAVVTDPPYGLGDKWNGGAGGVKSSWRIPQSEAKAWDMKPADGVVELPSLGECIIWGGNYYALPPTRCWLLWDKKQDDNWTTAQAEMAWTNLDRPVRTFRMAQCEAYSRMNKQHPAQKPIALMLWCLRWITGECIFDPYMGSGTTGVAAACLDRSFIGVEISRTYFDIAVQRFSDALSRPLFDQKPRAEQGALWE